MTIELFNDEGLEPADAQTSAETAAKMHIDHLVGLAVADGRELATVRTISAIDDIPGADLIKVAQVEGWKVVVKAGEFRVGDLCVFLEVDTFIQLSDTRFAFLEKNKITWQGVEGVRLKTIRLRKQISQGLALPVSLFPELNSTFALYNPATGMVKRPGMEGTTMEDFPLRDMNFTGLLGLMKWEKVMSAQLAGKAKGNFPSWIQKSDQERCQNMGAYIFGYDDVLADFDPTGIPEDAIERMTATGELRDAGGVIKRVYKAKASRDTRYEVTLKLDGSSMTVYSRATPEGEVTYGVCSRNLDLKIEDNDDNSFVIAARPIFDLLADMEFNVALQGELMGPGIQGNREGFTYNRFFIYNIFDIQAGEYLSPPARKAWIENANVTAKNLLGEQFMLEHVPVLHYDVTLAEIGITDMDSLLSAAIGPSMVNPVREGLVFKAMNGEQQFKAISNLFLEQEK